MDDNKETATSSDRVIKITKHNYATKTIIHFHTIDSNFHTLEVQVVSKETFPRFCQEYDNYRTFYRKIRFRNPLFCLGGSSTWSYRPVMAPNPIEYIRMDSTGWQSNKWNLAMQVQNRKYVDECDSGVWILGILAFSSLTEILWKVIGNQTNTGQWNTL